MLLVVFRPCWSGRTTRTGLLVHRAKAGLTSCMRTTFFGVVNMVEFSAMCSRFRRVHAPLVPELVWNRRVQSTLIP